MIEIIAIAVVIQLTSAIRARLSAKWCFIPASSRD
jgi:hypothetical protein